jgi:hypothetical protein
MNQGVSPDEELPVTVAKWHSPRPATASFAALPGSHSRRRAASRFRPRRANIAQAIRSVLIASTTETRRAGFFASKPAINVALTRGFGTDIVNDAGHSDHKKSSKITIAHFRYGAEPVLSTRGVSWRGVRPKPLQLACHVLDRCIVTKRGMRIDPRSPSAIEPSTQCRKSYPGILGHRLLCAAAGLNKTDRIIPKIFRNR